MAAPKKHTFAVYRCQNEGCMNPHKSTTKFNKREGLPMEKSMFCSKCRKHTAHKSKEMKSGSAGNKK